MDSNKGSSPMGSGAGSLIAGLFVLLAAGCTALPRGAAVQNDILKSAQTETPQIAVYPVTGDLIDQIGSWPDPEQTRHRWIPHSDVSDVQVIRPGDTLDMMIWDSGENSLLTGTNQRSTEFSDVRVTASGMIFVPYVGKLKITGRSPENARALVQRKLEESVPSAQVQLRMSEGRRNSIDLIGGVRAPGSIPLPDQNFSVLSAISAGGGVLPTLVNPQVRLLRGHDVYATSIERLFADPALDTRLRGGDKVIVEPDSRYFVALGAAGQEAQHPFNRDAMSALDALALIGGVNDSRADLRGVLILREYPRATSAANGPTNTRVVFTLDLTKSDSLFSARNFPIHHGDLVLATESPLTNTQTIIALFGSAFGVFRATD